MATDPGNVGPLLTGAAELVKAVPVYQDSLQPAAKELGKSLLTVAKTVNVLLSPLAGLVWSYDQVRTYLEGRLAEELASIPPADIQAPAARLFGPAIEAIRLNADEPELRIMFSRLIATAMDAKSARAAHPCFVEFLNQMVSDEAKIVQVFAQRPFIPTASLMAETSEGFVSLVQHWSHVGELAGCAAPELITSYLRNLERLGIIDLFDDRPITSGNPYAELKARPAFQTMLAQAVEVHGGTVRNALGTARLTPLGRQFCDACLPRT